MDAKDAKEGIFKFDSKDKIAIICIGLFFIINFISLFSFYGPTWDESVYMHASEYIRSAGAHGFIEALRPNLFSLMIAPFSSIFAMRLFVLILSVASLWFLYKIAKKYLPHPYVFPIITILYTMYFICSTSILTDIPAIFFHIISIYYLLEKKYYASGIFAALSFFTRFTFGIFFFTSIVFILTESRINIKASLKYLIGILCTLPLLIINIILYNNQASNIFQAAIFPIISQYKDSISSPYLWFYQGSALFYLKMIFSYPLLGIFLIIGLIYAIVYYVKHHTKAYLLFIIQMIIPLLYLSFSPRKFDRYILLAIIWVLFMASLGISSLIADLEKRMNKRVAYIFTMSIMTIIIVILSITVYDNTRNAHYDESFYTGYYYHLKNVDVGKTILVSMPMVDSNGKMIIGYYDEKYFFNALNQKHYDYVYYNPDSFPCMENDSSCLGTKHEIKQILDAGYKMDYNTTYDGEEYYIYSG